MPGKYLEAQSPSQQIQPLATGSNTEVEVSELRYRRLFESARDGILILDSNHRKITDANPFMTELLGYSYEQLIGKELWEIGLLKDKEASQMAFQQLKLEGYIRYEDLPLVNLRGERREVEFVSNLYQEGANTVIQCNIRDITDRKRVETKLAVVATRNERIADSMKISELRYRRLFESAQDGILMLDPNSGEIVDANPFMTDLLGYSRDELIGKELWEIGLLMDKQASQVAFHQLTQEGFIRYEDLPLQNRRGESRDVEFVSSMYREGVHSVIQCNIRDITERKAVEAKLAAAATRNKHTADAMKVSELRYRSLFETARDGILMLDSTLGKIADANPFMTELLGYSHDDLIGKELWEIGLLLDKDASQKAFRQLQQDGYIRYEDLPLENLRGERREVEFLSNLYREGGITVIQCNIRDITDRKAVEGKLAVAAAKNERIAETLQRSMLQASPAGKFAGIAIETLYEAGLHEAEVGGDFFDAFALDANTVALIVGDVSGKGLAAAARTSEVKYALRAFLHANHASEVALAQLNDFIYETHLYDKNSGETFIVLAIVVVNTVTGEAVFSAAGAEPSMILRSDGTVEMQEIIGMPLGIQAESTYITKTTVLEVGDSVLMATDGITEARRDSAFLGVDGMASLAAKAGPTTPLYELRESIYGGALEFAGGRLRDDVCLLVARRQ